jgi:hypothetical protein
MGHALRTALLALVLAVSAPPAPADPGAPPGLADPGAAESLAAIARLRGADETEGGCTAVLVAPDLAFAAGHCARGAVAGPNAMTLHFRPDLAPPAPRIAVRAVAFHADNVPGTLTMETAHADLALLRLAMPVPAEVARPIPLGAGGTPERVAIYGYLNGSGDRLHGHPECGIVALGPGLLASDCTVMSGFSGAALLSGRPGAWRLEGIAVARAWGETLRALAADVTPWPDFAVSEAAPPEPGAAPSPAGETRP